MKYMIEFELPDNDTVLREIKTVDVAWGIWGYSGCTKAKPAQRWIPCTPETMPEKAGRYVCTYIHDGKKDVFMFRFEDGGWIVPWYVEAITAWYKPLDPWEGEKS